MNIYEIQLLGKHILQLLHTVHFGQCRIACEWLFAYLVAKCKNYTGQLPHGQFSPGQFLAQKSSPLEQLIPRTIANFLVGKVVKRFIVMGRVNCLLGSVPGEVSWGNWELTGQAVQLCIVMVDSLWDSSAELGGRHFVKIITHIIHSSLVVLLSLML